MSDPSTTGLPCGFIVGVHDSGAWEGFEKPCGFKNGTRKDPRSERYDDGLCPTHWPMVFGPIEEET